MQTNWYQYPYQLVCMSVPAGLIIRTNWYASKAKRIFAMATVYFKGSYDWQI